MSHTPPVPEASVAPWPAHPEPHPHGYAPRPPAPPETGTTAADERTRRVITGAAVGIGSAAIVAALLYVNRKPGKVTPKPYERTDWN